MGSAHPDIACCTLLRPLIRQPWCRSFWLPSQAITPAISVAEDAKSLIAALRLGATDDIRFRLMGVFMGGMIVQAYALVYPEDLLSLTLACTYAFPGPFSSRRFCFWADAVPVIEVPAVMRDVLLSALTQDFFRNPEKAAELEEVEKDMREMTMSLKLYVGQLNVIRKFDEREWWNEVSITWKIPISVLVDEEDILIPVSLSKELYSMVPGAKWKEVKSRHTCMWEFLEEFSAAFVSFIKEVQKGIKM